MNVAITGACGLLGAHLAAAFSVNHRVFGLDRHRWWGTRPIELLQGDLADAKTRKDFLEYAKPDVLIHCAAMVNVDACEDQPADAYFSNGTLTGLLARAVPSYCHVIYVTTDGIFRGDSAMQRETDLPCPRTVYGRSKLQGEWEAQLATESHTIIRTNFFGWSSGRKRTFAEWLYNALVGSHPITLFDDFWFTPIYVPDLVDRILALLNGRHCGTYNVVGATRISKYQFGMQLASEAGLSAARVVRGSIDRAAFAAARPRDMSLCSAKLEAVLGRAAPDYRDGLRRFLADRERSLETRVAQPEKTAAS